MTLPFPVAVTLTEPQQLLFAVPLTTHSAGLPGDGMAYALCMFMPSAVTSPINCELQTTVQNAKLRIII
jgi:hypothetical protein